jgi:C4-dicarboxylate-specific signal transduction histidine kinase
MDTGWQGRNCWAAVDMRRPRPPGQRISNVHAGAVPAAGDSSQVHSASRPSLSSRIRSKKVAAFAVTLVLSVLTGALWLEHHRRRRAEAKARGYLATMAHMDRRSAMANLTASLAHELHQPLGAILRNSEAAKLLLASATLNREELWEIVEDIRKEDKRASEIIRRLRAFLQNHELKEEQVDLNDLARESVQFASAAAASRGVFVQVDLQPTQRAVVTGDRVHLQQVLLNLVINGLDAMADTPPEHRRLIVATATADGHADVSVQDAGSGIPDHAIRKMFDPFFTTKADGMGMGLAVARSIVEAHNGRIAAMNNAHRGATVLFSLPLRRRKEAAQC